MRFAVAMLFFLTSVPGANAAITFNFTYSDTTVGFADASLGATRRATVEAVAAYVNTVIDENGTVEINWNASQNSALSNTLASMGSKYFVTPGFSNGLVFQHATTGVDPFPGGTDGSGQINFGHNWNSGLNAPGASQFDLFSVVLHELSHAMGVASLMSNTGNSAIPGVFSVYDSFLETGSGTPLVDAAGNFAASVSDLTADDIFLNLSASGGGLLKVYAPSPYEPGSSISHFDTSLGTNVVMQPSIGAGTMRRQYSEQDRAILRAIGYNVRAVPEPNSLLLVGIVVALSSFRRRHVALPLPLQD